MISPGGVYNWRLLEFSWDPLSFALQIVAKLICVCLCLLDAIVELHAMVEKTNNNLF